MQKTRTLIILAVALSFLCACRGGRSEEGGGEDSTKAVRIAYIPTLDALPFFVAKEMGWFEREGVEVNLERFLAQMDIDTALVGGSVDGAFTDKVRVAHMEEKFGLQLDILATTAAEWTLVTNKVARLNKLEQFGDKMVAMTRFSATDSLTDLAFKSVKTTAPMFKVQINDVELRLRMVDNNEMDAAWFPEPYATRAQLLGHKRLLSSEKFGISFGVLVLRSDYEKQKGNKEKAEALRRVYSMACDSIDKCGLQAYAAQIQTYCGVDSAVVHHLNEIKFKQ